MNKEKKNIEEVTKEIDGIEDSHEVKEVIVERKSGFNTLEVLIIMVITVLFGSMVGGFAVYSKLNSSKITPNNVPKDLEELVGTYNDIVDNYYENVDKKELLDAGIKGMIEYLGDPYSNYLDTTATNSFNEQVNGEYVGIGTEIQLTSDNKIILANPYEDGPAYKAGIRKGDELISVDGKNVGNMPLTEVVRLIKGEKGTIVKVKVLRDNKELDFSIKRDKVELTSAVGQIFERNDQKIGYIKLSVFAANSYNQFQKELLALEKEGIDSLIIDVRNNSGGYLDIVKNIASLFVDKSKIIYQFDTKGVIEPVYSTNTTKRDYKIAVLINKNSASASEILAGALLESYGASVIGTNSFGKGTVQKTHQLESGALVKYTIQKWLTPKGNWINEVGITPTIVVDQDEEYYQNPSVETDKQLQKALEVLSNTN